MDKRYVDERIAEIWSNLHKLELWQDSELAVIEARVNLGLIGREIFETIAKILRSTPIDIDWWLKRENEIHHDLQAFIEERLRHLPSELQKYFHQEMTSYDTEEPAFARMIKDSLKVVNSEYFILEEVLKEMAIRYRYTPVMGVTHGQWAKVQSFGKRVLTWLQDLRLDINHLKITAENLNYSKLSGAIGNYGTLDPEIEKEALRILGFKPYYGATQIMPREIYTPVAQALCQIVQTLDKIATAIRLGARSGRPIYQEPFGKKQKGSSAMPHKQNTISTEQIEGMARMAKGFFGMIMDNIKTWEERTIEQSSVERVAWPDLFYVVVHSLKVMTRVLKGLRVYPDNMLYEITESRDCYASEEVKGFLKEVDVSFGLTTEDAYRIVQLAAFNVFKLGEEARKVRENPPSSFSKADELLLMVQQMPQLNRISIKEIISAGLLKISSELDITSEEVKRWNEILKKIFMDKKNCERWNKIFSLSYLLRNEEKLYQEILGEK